MKMRVKYPYSEQEIANDFYQTMDNVERQFVKDIPDRKFMELYSDTVGQFIRSEYHLWDRPPHRPEIIDGIDISPQHPNSISGRILENIWDLCHAK